MKSSWSVMLSTGSISFGITSSVSKYSIKSVQKDVNFLRKSNTGDLIIVNRVGLRLERF